MLKHIALCLVLLLACCVFYQCEPATGAEKNPADAAAQGDQERQDTQGPTPSEPQAEPTNEPPQERGTPEPPGPGPDAAGPDTSVPESPPVDRSGPQDTPTPPDVRPPTLCQGRSPMAGEATWKLKHDGVERSFLVFLPPQYDAKKPLPLVLNFHGLAGSSSGEKRLTKMNDLAKKEGFIVVYPQGRGFPASWNAGKCCAPANSSLKSKDVAFVSAMLDDLEKKLCVDKRRIFSTGMSNGGHISYRLACELSDRIAAFAPVAAVLLHEPCQPKRPVPLIAFHGTSDAIVAYKGSTIRGYPSVQKSIDFWVKHNQCNPKAQESYKKGDSTCKKYSSCQGGTSVELCTIDKGGHTWPGGNPFPLGGRTTKDIDATGYMWQFFKQHPLP